MSSTPRRVRLRVAVATGAVLAFAMTTACTGSGSDTESGTATTDPSPASLTPPDGADPGPAATGAAWLAERLAEDGLLEGDFGPLHGQSIDAALALDAVGDQEDAISAVAAAVEDAAGSYVEYEFEGEDGEVSSGEVAGATGKALVLADLVDGDTGSFGGIDLVQRAESLLVDDGPAVGRSFDTAQGEPDHQYANSLGQAFVVRGLHEAGSARAQEALDYLLDQQCPDGHFRQEFPDIDAETQDCTTPATDDAGPDTTATVILQLHALAAEDTEVDDALTAATEWLVQRQTTDGAFDAGAETGGPNANSTGLAGWALGLRGMDDEASQAAAWVRALQVPDQECGDELDDEAGAIAFDEAALAAGRADGLEETFQQWNVTATQALPSLLWTLEGEQDGAGC
ncbi:MAG: hypothetical protein Q8Q02_15395 [Nocardioides sp.]|nr:hypothetical protein [Nocardioides sp.]